jgi:hypothetical protein
VRVCGRWFHQDCLCQTTENKSEMFTNNVNGEAYDEHIDNYIMDHKDITRNG